MKLTHLFGTLLCALFFSAAQASEPAAEITLTPIRVSPHVWYFRGESGMASTANKGYMSNAGFVVTKTEVVVFDTLGTPALGEAMIAAIRKISRLPIRLVLISHYHADHFYGLQAFRKVGAEVQAHKNARGYLASNVAQERLKQRQQDLFPWVDDDTRLIPPDRYLEGGGSFKRGGMEFRIIDVHGSHAEDDLMLYLPSEGVLFAGDLFFSGRVPFVGDAHTGHWLKALDRMLESRPKFVIPGHGNASANPLPDIQLTRDYLIDLRQKMGAAVAELQPFEEVYAKTDWSKYAKLPAFDAANRLNAYNVYIQMEQEALSK